MKRTVAFGALMLFLGLSLAPRPTVASKDETLAILCFRFQQSERETWRRIREEGMAVNAKGQPYAATQRAIVASLAALRGTVCAQ